MKGINTTSVVQSGNSFFAAGVHSAFTAGPVVTTTKGGLKERSAPPGPAVFATSTDGGKTWQTIHPTGLPKVAVQSLSVDPSNSKTIYAITTNGAFYKSSDGAHSFAVVSPKLGIPPWALAVTQGTNFVSGDMDNGSHISTNGKTWTATPFTDGRGTHMVMEYAVQPGDTTRIIMSSVGIELSTDGGKTWSPALEVDRDVRPDRVGLGLVGSRLRRRLRRLAVAYDRQRQDLDARHLNAATTFGGLGARRAPNPLP